MEIGRNNILRATRTTDNGMYLMDEEGLEILLPNKYIPNGLSPNDSLEVFVYTDSEDRLVATTLTPGGFRDEFACLQVKDLSKFGAFMDWGLEKDLLVPFSEQRDELSVGQKCIVYIYLDKVTSRLLATVKLGRMLEHENIELLEDEKVDLLVGEEKEIGVEVIVNNLYRGLVFKNELFKSLEMGDRCKGYVKKVRVDGKVDITLQKRGYAQVESVTDEFIDALKRNNGFLNLTDKSNPEEIKTQLKMSKKVFKKTLGALYKQRIIRIEEDGVYLVDVGNDS